jgi:hypothetical protein
MALERKQYWDTRAYHEFLLQRASAPFVWGAHDCALFAADGIEAITGVDIAADFRGKYHDEASAAALIKQVCGGSSVADAALYCARKHGLVEWSKPLFAQRGDLVIAKQGAGMIAGLVHLNGHIVAAGEKGLMIMPITTVQRSWHV